MGAVLLSTLGHGAEAEKGGGKIPAGEAQVSPVCLSANDMSIATGTPSRVNMADRSTFIPVWSLSGLSVGQSVVGLVNVPPGWNAVKVAIVVTTDDKMTNPQYEDVYRVHLSQMVDEAAFSSRNSTCPVVRTALPAAPFQTRTIVLESFYKVVPNVPLSVRIQREPGDPADTFVKPTGLAMVKVFPVKVPPESHVVQNVSGYNSWPMIQAIGNKLVCVYSRGSKHSNGEEGRAVYARTSTDNGKTWTKETVVAGTPKCGEVEVGKGLDSDGAMLLWVRRIGKGVFCHDLYRTTDGIKFDLVTTPVLSPNPMQITDIFKVPTVGLMALWFSGNYCDDNNSWGTLTSSDNGKTWKQTTIEDKLPIRQWPTEPSAVYLGAGKILVIARIEGGGPAQFQMVSTDYGKTWTRKQTNIKDVYGSTPSLILDPQTNLLSNYYYQRGKGILWRRVVDPKTVFDNPLKWPPSEVIAVGSRIALDSGNVNATTLNGKHYVSYYSGKAPDTAIFVAEVPAPAAGE